MGEVYRARDEKLNRDVAIQVLPATLSQNADRLRRFEQEVQAAGAVMGTVGYMSPEQVRGRHVDHRSGIFAFGAVLYEMLCGRRAFHGDSAVETLNAILKEEPPELTTTNRNIAPALERVVWHCLEKSPERRFQSATDVAFALESLSGSSGVSSQTLAAVASVPAPARIATQLPWIVSAL